MSEEKETVEDIAKSLPRRIFQREALLLIVAMTVGGAAVVLAQQQQTHASEESLGPILRRVQTIEDAGRRHEAQSDQVHLELKSDMAELARDVRELYRVVRDPTRRSERLEGPPTVSDGGR